MTRPERQRRADDYLRHIPVHVVWEITLACDLKCLHCGSRAGARRQRELTTAECLDVVSSLARLEAREVTLIGGEAYLRSDWIEIVRAMRARDAMHDADRRSEPDRRATVGRGPGGTARDRRLDRRPRPAARRAARGRRLLQQGDRGPQVGAHPMGSPWA